MPTFTSDHKQHSQLQSATVKDFAQALKKARETSRQIVPIVGAGLSADCGFPVITAIVRYFGKLYRYIEERGPLQYAEVPSIKYLDHLFEGYKKEPWKFVEHFGWPDRFELNQNLYTLLRKSHQNEPPENLVEDAVREGLDRILPDVNSTGSQAYKELSEEIKKKLNHARDGLVKDDAREALDDAIERLEKNWSKSAAFDIVGDWRRLILSFTNYRSDYADALFARFGSSRQPGQGHRFLTFLVKYLAVPTVFTFNFDSLIEQALESEGARPRVFAMERGAGLPHAGLVRDSLSVIKMHGSTHALLLDEQLDRPLSPEYLQRFAQITGTDPLLLVVGCSESDRRLRDLVAYVVRPRTTSNHSSSNGAPSVVWLHYEQRAPHFLKELSAESQAKILVCPTNNPGATLQHLYSWLTSGNPAGQLPYLAHVQPPVHRGKTVDEQDQQDAWPQKNSFEVISSLPQKNRIPSASHQLLKRANHWARNGYHFIWVDLEAVHTFAGVVGSIIDQCRKYDPDLAPSVLPVHIDGIELESENPAFLTDTINLAAQRVARALRRTRYYLALDGLETYVWPATTHHGVSHMAIEKGAELRLKYLGKFLEQLKREELGESLVGISVDDPKSRHDNDLSKYLQLQKLVRNVKRVSARSVPFPPDTAEFNFNDHFKDLAKDLPVVSLKTLPKATLSGALSKQKARLALVLFHLSCFRRIRPIVAVRNLIEPLLGEENNQDQDAVDKILQPFIEKWGGYVLQQLEGGGYWFTRAIRNEVYTQNTRYTDTHEITMCLTGRKDDNSKLSTKARGKLCRDSAFQLGLAAMIHQRIARTWYTRTFVQSQDTFSFLEYTYHRVSSIRSLVKLRRLAQVACKDETIARAVIVGISKLGELIKRLNPAAPPFKQLEFETSDFIFELINAKPSTLFRKRDAVEIIKDVEAALAKRHCDELGSLYRAWTRSEVSLRTQVAAEQLLHWCDELLTDDLVHRCNRVVIGYDKSGKSKKPPKFLLKYHKFQRENQVDDELIDPELEQGEIREFRQYLQDLQVKLWIERSDYQTGISKRWRHLIDNAPQPMREEMMKKYVSKDDRIKKELLAALDKDVGFINSCDVSQCHRLLDIVGCKLQWEQESSFGDREWIENRKGSFALLKRVRQRLRKIKKPSTKAEANNWNEAWLRLLHLQAENQLGRISMFSHDGFTGGPNSVKRKAVKTKEVRNTITEGLERITSHDARTDQAPRSVVLDPTTDGALYLQYRSVFYLLRGRAEWLQQDDEAFQKAGWAFEMARGGLGNNSPLMSALIELYAVEALLGRARKVLFEAASYKDGKKCEAACVLAQGLYESARGGLQRARESLLVSRRNVIWRKFFFRLTTQYHADRLFLGYARLKPLVETLKEQWGKGTVKDEDRESCEQLLRHFLLRLRRAYHSLLTAVDLYLPRSIDQERTERVEPCPNRFRWLYRMWWELTLCGYSTGQLALTLDNDLSQSDRDEYVTAQLKWLNETNGIDASELGQWVNDKYGFLKKQYESIKSKSNGKPGAKRALEERRTLVALAMKAAERR